jgi:hypothetical protein
MIPTIRVIIQKRWTPRTLVQHNSKGFIQLAYFPPFFDATILWFTDETDYRITGIFTKTARFASGAATEFWSVRVCSFENGWLWNDFWRLHFLASVFSFSVTEVTLVLAWTWFSSQENISRGTQYDLTSTKISLPAFGLAGKFFLILMSFLSLRALIRGNQECLQQNRVWQN